MTPRPAHWAGTTIRSHRVPAGGEHRATSGRSSSRVLPYVAAGAGALFMAFSVLVGFHIPTGVVPAWERERPPAGKLFPLDPPDTSSSLPSDNPGSEGEVGEGPGRASRSRSGPADEPEQPEQPAPTDAPRPSEAVPSVAAAPEPLITVMPTPGCPPPLPVPVPKKPKVTHPPKVPRVLDRTDILRATPPPPR